MRDADRFRVDATWRFAKRHKVRALYFSVNQSASKTLTRHITIGDTVYPVDASLDARVSAKVVALAYDYAFLQREDFEVTGSFGVHAIKFGFEAIGTESVNEQHAQIRTETAGATAPLPVSSTSGLAPAITPSPPGSV